MDFVGELSNWYLRLSRDRFKNNDSQETNQVFGYVLYTLAQLFAPFAPFFSEMVHHALVDQDTSVHHTDWPGFSSDLQDKQLEEQMNLVQRVVELAHSARKLKGVRVRQPLASIKVMFDKNVLHTEMFEQYSKLLELELNVKKVIWEKTDLDETTIEFDWELTADLKEEGEAREVMRLIQNLRREAGLSITDSAKAVLIDWPESWREEIESKTSTKLVKGDKQELLVE